MKNELPMVSVMRCASSRAAMSGAPPGGIVTRIYDGMIRILRAVACPANSAKRAKPQDRAVIDFILPIPPPVSFFFAAQPNHRIVRAKARSLAA